MQFGSIAKSSFALLAINAALSFALEAQPLRAQYMEPRATQGGYGGPSQGGAMQALFASSGRRMFGGQQSPYMDANGNPVVVPAQYCQQCPGGCPGYCGDCGQGQ